MSSVQPEFGFDNAVHPGDQSLTVDTVITIPDDRLLEFAPEGTSSYQAFRQAVQWISDIITTPGLIKRDFSDIGAIMLGMGHAMMGTAPARGEGAVVKAAINSALMEAGGVKGARGVLINNTASSQLGIHEVNEDVGGRGEVDGDRDGFPAG